MSPVSTALVTQVLLLEIDSMRARRRDKDRCPNVLLNYKPINRGVRRGSRKTLEREFSCQCKY
jgi:hypothetical protein